MEEGKENLDHARVAHSSNHHRCVFTMRTIHRQYTVVKSILKRPN